VRAAEGPRLDRAPARRSLPGIAATAWDAADGWLLAPGSARRLAAVRMGLCAMLAERVARGIYMDLAAQPHALYRPVSFMRLVGGMPGRGTVAALQGAAVVAAIMAAIGLRARIALPVAWTCALVLNGMATSAGKVVHNDVLLLLAMIPLLFAPLSDRWSADALLARRHGAVPGNDTSPRYGWPVRSAMAVVAGVYFLIGLNKVILSGPAWVLSGNLRWVLYAASDVRRVPNGFALFIADRPILAHVMAGAALGIELAFPLVLWSRKLRPFLVGGVVALHLGIMVAMGLDYTAWIVTDIVVFVDWPKALHQVNAVRRRVEGPAP